MKLNPIVWCRPHLLDVFVLLFGSNVILEVCFQATPLKKLARVFPSLNHTNIVLFLAFDQFALLTKGGYVDIYV